DRRGLRQAYRRLVNSGYPIDGASDHEVSEAIYLSDPDGNGVELYADRPSTEWRWRYGQVVMTTMPLDIEDLLKAAPPEPAGGERSPRMEIGHIHLHVADLAQAERFYSEFLGLAVTQRSYPGALFLAAGGYHHHIAVNTWGSRTAPPPNSVGLVSYRIEVPVAEILYCLGHRAPLLGYETRTESQEQGGQVLKIRDPNGAWLEVQASSITGGPSAKADCAAGSIETRTIARLQGGKV
ncbi:MAG: VOC family protein, partial [Limisphaerales bacterium]